MKKLTQKGFTIIELMIASLVFTSLLLLCLEGITRVAKVYVKNSSISRTNEFVRTLSEDISQQIKFGASNPRFNGTSPTIKYLCSGGYAYQITLNTPNRPIKRIEKSSCDNFDNPVITIYSDSSEIKTPDQLRVLKFDISEPSSAIWKVNIKVSLGEPDLLRDSESLKPLTDSTAVFSNGQCIPNLAGSEYCAVIELTTFSTRRLN